MNIKSLFKDNKSIIFNLIIQGYKHVLRVSYFFYLSIIFLIDAIFYRKYLEYK